MQATSFFSTGRSDKNFTIAIALIAILGVAELIAIGTHYAGRMRAARKAVPPAAVTTEPVAPVIAPSVAPETAAAQAQPSAAPPAAAPAAAPQSTPSTAALSVAENLLKEATLLRERGDTNNALARLQEASQRD